MPTRVNQAILNRLRRLELRDGGQGKAYLRWLNEGWPQPPRTPEGLAELEAVTIAEQAELMRQCAEGRASVIS